MNKTTQKIVDQIIDALNKDVAPWRKPWTVYTAEHQNLVSKRPYQGTNALLFWATEILKPDSAPTPYWLTFNQIKKLGGKLKKGSKGQMVVFYTMLEKEDQETGEIKKFPWMKFTYVFNAEHTEGIEYPKPELFDHSPIEKCEKMVSDFPNMPTLDHGGNRAFYRPSAHHIQLPDRERFQTAEHYYATLFHEMVHSTMKDMGRNLEFDREGYSFEELIAEIGAAFLCAHAGISNNYLVENTTAYCKGWAKALKDNPTWIQKAASQAQRAVDHLLNKKANEVKAAA